MKKGVPPSLERNPGTKTSHEQVSATHTDILVSHGSGNCQLSGSEVRRLDKKLDFFTFAKSLCEQLITQTTKQTYPGPDSKTSHRFRQKVSDQSRRMLD